VKADILRRAYPHPRVLIHYLQEEEDEANQCSQLFNELRKINLTL
jgi:hypothetical protein